MRFSAPSPILLCAAAVFCGSVMDASAKGVAMVLPMATMLWWRFAIASVVVTTPYLIARKSFGGKEALRFHIVRGIIHAATVYMFFTGITLLPLAEATVLGFTAVLMVPFLERVALGEPIRSTTLAAAIIGFTGVLIINGGFTIGDLTADQVLGRILCLVSAFLYAIMLLMLRARAAKDGTHLIAVYSNIMPATWLFVPMVMAGTVPSLDQFPYLVWLALVGAGTWMLMTAAYAKAPAQVLAPLEYTSLIWASILGYFFFDEIPEGSLWLGAFFVMAAVALVSFQDKLRARPASASRAPVVPDAPVVTDRDE